MRLLVTRPEPDGERTAQALRARGHAVVLAPLLRTEPVAFALPDRAFSAVVLTSANAARAVAAHRGLARLVALPAFAVGRRTADAARAVGFRDVHSADGDKADLGDLLRAQFGAAREPLLYLAGEDRAGEMSAGDLVVHTAVVYRAVKAEGFEPPVAAALAEGALDGVLHFSARSTEAYLACAARGGIAIGRSRRCIIVSRARWRRRLPPPAPLRCASRPARTRRRCWSWWARRKANTAGDGIASAATSPVPLARHPGYMGTRMARGDGGGHNALNSLLHCSFRRPCHPWQIGKRTDLVTSDHDQPPASGGPPPLRLRPRTSIGTADEVAPEPIRTPRTREGTPAEAGDHGRPGPRRLPIPPRMHDTSAASSIRHLAADSTADLPPRRRGWLPAGVSVIGAGVVGAGIVLVVLGPWGCSPARTTA